MCRGAGGGGGGDDLLSLSCKLDTADVCVQPAVSQSYISLGLFHKYAQTHLI